MNTNYPLTGTVDVVFRAYSQFTLNGKTYDAGEPVAYIKDTEASLMYGGHEKTATSVKNLTAFTDTFPESVVIDANVFKDAILKMFAEPINEPFIEASKLVFVTTDSNGDVYLDNNIVNIYIYNESMTKITSFSVDNTTGLVSGLTADTNYYIDYSVKKEQFSGYGLKTVFLPYLTIEMKGTTSVAGAAKSFLVKVPRAKLNMTPSFLFRAGEMAATSLAFKIITEKNSAGVEIYFF